jgi:LPS export ABC transporter protein LptC
MRLKSLFTLLSLALIALLIWWFRLVDDRPAKLLISEDQHFIDAYMRDFTLTAMNAEGKPSYTLRAHEFNHYNDRDIATLQLPVIYLEKDKSNWQLSSLEGEINDAQNQIVLYNQVVMQQIPVAEAGETVPPGVRLRTERLDIDTNQQLASTDLLTQIDYKHLSLSARGMRLDNLKGRLELLAEVKGVYDIP